MSYNPNVMDPPDNPNAVWCHYCTDQMFEEDIEEAYDTFDGELVHKECLPEYTWAVELAADKRERSLSAKIEKILLGITS